jgi:hypothetical protein
MRPPSRVSGDGRQLGQIDAELANGVADFRKMGKFTAEFDDSTMRGYRD